MLRVEGRRRQDDDLDEPRHRDRTTGTPDRAGRSRPAVRRCRARIGTQPGAHASSTWPCPVAASTRTSSTTSCCAIRAVCAVLAAPTRPDQAVIGRRPDSRRPLLAAARGLRLHRRRHAARVHPEVIATIDVATWICMVGDGRCAVTEEHAARTGHARADGPPVRARARLVLNRPGTQRRHHRQGRRHDPRAHARRTASPATARSPLDQRRRCRSRCRQPLDAARALRVARWPNVRAGRGTSCRVMASEPRVRSRSRFCRRKTSGPRPSETASGSRR